MLKILTATLFSVPMFGCSCNCETETEDFGWQIGMFIPPEYALPKDLTPHRVLDAASKKFLNADFESLNPPTALREAPCSKSKVNDLTCTYWFEAESLWGFYSQEGIKLTFVAGSNGKISSINVREIHRRFRKFDSAVEKMEMNGQKQQS